RDNPAVLTDIYKLNAAKLTEVLKEKFGSKWTLLIRLHPNVAWVNFSNDIFGDAENIINVTSYPDIQELLVISDVLISDYSSVIYDFMILHKPVFIFAKDFDSYPKERGFNQLYFDLPFKVNRTEDELLDCIKNFDAATLEPKIKRFFDMVKPFDNGHASEEVVKKIDAVVSLQELNAVSRHAPTFTGRG
ncbi:MAG: CDP-glycerol glycerophosphotransferase family protein, partial [Selenomonadaceae bacterium]|nr:CDP-glycerol glycerophosphotransferase family protein [Selenomonadaceae bacterium]